MRHRYTLGLLLGLCLSIPLLVAEPAVAAAEVAALQSVAYTTETAAPQPNLATFNLAVQANHATASASETRTSMSVIGLTVDCGSSAQAVLLSSRDPLDEEHPDPDDGMRLSLRDPGEDSDAGDEDDGMRLAG